MEIACPAVKRDSDRFDFAAGEFQSAHRKIAPLALRGLVGAFADDLTELAAACQQLIADVPGDITEQIVERYYGGRVETTVSFAEGTSPFMTGKPEWPTARDRSSGRVPKENSVRLACRSWP